MAEGGGLAGEVSPRRGERTPGSATRRRGREGRADQKLKQKIGDLVLDSDILREALKPYPLDRKTSDVTAPSQVFQNDEVVRCSASVGRATSAGRAGRRGRRTEPPGPNSYQLIQRHPTFGYRRLQVLLRYQGRMIVNRKAVYRVLKQKRWFVHQRVTTSRPRVQGWVSQGQSQ